MNPPLLTFGELTKAARRHWVAEFRDIGNEDIVDTCANMFNDPWFFRQTSCNELLIDTTSMRDTVLLNLWFGDRRIDQGHRPNWKKSYALYQVVDSIQTS